MDLVILQTFDNYFSANIELTRLRSAGIECYLKDEYTVTIDPILSNAIGGIKILVRKEEEYKIRKLLREMNASTEHFHCPQCGSNNFMLIPKRSPENIFTAITTWLLSSYAVSVKNIYKCEGCGFESDTLPEPQQELYN